MGGREGGRGEGRWGGSREGERKGGKEEGKKSIAIVVFLCVAKTSCIGEWTLCSLCSPPERSAIVTKDEQEALIQISQELEEMVVQKLENFRTCFPFGCPKDDLKVTIKLFNLVSM